MAEPPRSFSEAPLGKRLLRITWPFLAIVVLLVLLASQSLEIVSATRAYVGGESLWSKAQKDAVYHLLRYAQSRSDADYLRYRAEIAVPLGDREARLDLDKPEPDLAIVRRGFLQGRNDADDIDGMILLYRRFGDTEFMRKAIDIWVEGDERIAELDALAERLHQAIAVGDAQPATLEPILAGIDDVDRRLTPLEESFSRTLGAASRRTQQVLEITLVVVSTLLLGLGAMLSRRMLLRGEALEQALRVSEERFDLAVAGSNAGIWDWNVRTGDVYYSPRYRELVGYTGDEAFSDRIEWVLEHLHPDEREAHATELVRYLTLDSIYDAEIRLRTRSGEYRWFQMRGKSVRDRHGEPVRMVGSITDITDRKHAEAQLFAERDRARVTLESIADAVVTTDVRGFVEYLNPVAEALIGKSTDEARGLPLERVLRIVNDSDRAVALNPAEILLRESRPVRLEGDTVVVRRDGSEFAVDVSMAPIRDRAATIIGVVLVLKDVTGERAQAAYLAHLARHDALTGLVNRREFEQRLARALLSAGELDRRHAVLYLDLDRFKEVNDSCGHAAGDELLRAISAVLQRKLRERDTLARLGGDEFGVLLENCEPSDAVRIAEGLREAVGAFEFAWEARRFRVGASVGVVPIAGRDQTVAAVLNLADASCYKAKDEGRDRVHVAAI